MKKDKSIKTSLIKSNPNTPLDQNTSPQVLSTLATHEQASIRKAVSRHPNTPIKVLYELIAEFPEDFMENPALPLLTLENPNLFLELPAQAIIALIEAKKFPVYLFEELFEKKIFGFSLALAKNPTTPQHILLRCLGDRLYQIRQAALENPSTPQDAATLIRRAGHRASYQSPEIGTDPSLTRKEISRLADFGYFGLVVASKHPNTKPSLLEEISKTPTRFLHRALLRNPILPRKILRDFVEKNLSEVLLVKHARVTPSMLSRLAESGEENMRTEVAKHKKTPKRVLKKLLFDPSEEVRKNLVKNPKLSMSDIKILLGDRQKRVRKAALTHPNVSKKYLSLLYRAGASFDLSCILGRAGCLTKSECVRLKKGGSFEHSLLACHPETPLEILEEFFSINDLWLCTWIARNPNLSKDMFQRLFALGDSEVCFWLANHASCPHFLLEKFSKDPQKGFRYAVAKNPSTSVEILKKLSIDQEAYVRYGLTQNSRISLALLKCLAHDREEYVRIWANRALETKNPS